jgi:RsiW-degrading membrane proteinase PrsW (M82 family)
MIEFIIDSKIYIYAIASGVIPAIFWLWFWLKEDQDEPEPIGLIIISFILGGLLVFLAIFLQKASLPFLTDNTTRIIVWSAIEELLKFAGVAVIIYGNSNLDRPIDFPMYFIATALGFAAFENFLYLLSPFNVSGTIVGMLTGNLRFLGSTLLHAISSAMIGSAMGLSFYIKQYRFIYVTFGLILAITLHSLFNFFIMKGSGANFLSVFGFLWVVTIINILIFEKLKRMGRNIIPIYK